MIIWWSSPGSLQIPRLPKLSSVMKTAFAVPLRLLILFPTAQLRECHGSSTPHSTHYSRMCFIPPTWGCTGFLIPCLLYNQDNILVPFSSTELENWAGTMTPLSLTVNWCGPMTKFCPYSQNKVYQRKVRLPRTLQAVLSLSAVWMPVVASFQRRK